MLRVCQQLASTVQYLERKSFIITLASDLPMRTIKFCSTIFGVTSSLPVISKIY